MYVGLRTSDTLHKKPCRIGPGLCGTSENSVNAKFGREPVRWGQDFSGSCTVTSRNPLLQNGATKSTKSPRFDAEGVPPCRCRVLGAAPDGALATVNFAEFFFFHALGCIRQR